MKGPSYEVVFPLPSPCGPHAKRPLSPFTPIQTLNQYGSNLKSLWMKLLYVTIHMEAIEKYFHVVQLFIILHKAILTFTFVGATLVWPFEKRLLSITCMWYYLFFIMLYDCISIVFLILNFGLLRVKKKNFPRIHHDHISFVRLCHPTKKTNNYTLDTFSDIFLVISNL